MVVEGKLSGLVTLSTKGGEKKQFANLDSTQRAICFGFVSL